MDPIVFAFAVLALLATPGPTNTLLAASGATAGIRASIRLVPAEIAGYGVAITTLIVVAGPVIAQHPAAATGLRLAASLWLAVCAVRLWREAGTGFRAAPTPISFGRVFVTTLINPKGLIFAFTIFPPVPPADLAPWLAGFSGLVSVAAIGWIGVGGAIVRSAGAVATPRRIWRAAALGLAVFATVIAGSALATGF